MFSQGKLVLFDFNTLAQGAIFAIENQDFIVRGDHGVPIVALGEGLGLCAIGQGQNCGQRYGVCHGLNNCRYADDNQHNDGYKSGNHRGGQDRHEYSQEPQVCRFG